MASDDDTSSMDQFPPRAQLPEIALQLGKNLYPEPLHFKTMERLVEFRRAADYISAAMIFLKDNVLLERNLVHDDIKNIIGYWGISPGITLLYAHLNLVIQKYDQQMICLMGPNEGVPAILSCLWLEGSLERFYPQYSRDRKGLHHLITGFSVPGGFASHLNARIPGSIHENKDLGHVLSMAYGTVMDKPDLVTVAVIGDGEAETGPTATAWHMCRYIDPTTSGAVLPILYLNCYNSNGQTIFGSMENSELCCLFSGYGYQPCIVDDMQDVDRELSMALSWALETIREIQLAAKSGDRSLKPRWPMIVLRIPKGWGYPELTETEQPLAGSLHGHNVLLPHAKINAAQLRQLQEWLASYKPGEVLPDGTVSESIQQIFPANDKLKLGQNAVTWDSRHHLDVPEWRHFAVGKGDTNSCLAVAAAYLDEALARNKDSLRIFSPDGVVSCKLPDKLADRQFQAFRWDRDKVNKSGQVVEFMSEHTCQGLLQGYTMTGRTGIFAADECLFPAIAPMMTQYSKFLRLLKDTPWRKDVSSLNYITTGTWTRPESTALSQNPSFIGAVLNLKPGIGRVYLPPDANTFLSTVAHCLRSKNYINLVISSGHPEPTWLSPDQAEMHTRAGGSVWKFASSNDGIDPDVVLVGIGGDMTFEVIAAASYLRTLAPSLAVRVVNITDLMILGPGAGGGIGSGTTSHGHPHPHSLSQADFDTLFTPNRNVHFNYHGYAHELQGLLFGRPGLERITISSFQNESPATATTAFGTLLENGCSRYHVAEAAVRGAAKWNQRVAVDLQKLVTHIQHQRVKVEQFIHRNGVDPEGTFDVPRFRGRHGHHVLGEGEDWEAHDRALYLPKGNLF